MPLDGGAQSVRGERPRFEPAPALSGPLARFDVARQPALGVLEARGEHGAPFDQSRHLDLEVPAQHRHVRPALLEPTDALRRPRPSGPRPPPRRPRARAGSRVNDASSAPSRSRRSAIAARWRSASARSWPTDSTSDSTRLAGHLEPLALVLEPVPPGAPCRVASAAAPAARARAWSAKLTARSAASAAIVGLDGGLAGQRGQRVGAGADHPARRGEPVAVGADHRDVGTIEGHFHRPGPVAAHHHHASEKRSSTPATAGTRGRTCRATASPAAGADAARCRGGRGSPTTRHAPTWRRARCPPPPVRAVSASTARAAADTVDHDGTQRRTDGGLEGGDPAVVDVDEIPQDPEHAGRPRPAPRRRAGALIGTWRANASARASRPVTLALGGAQRLLGVTQTAARPRRRRGDAPRPAGPDPGARGPAV